MQSLELRLWRDSQNDWVSICDMVNYAGPSSVFHRGMTLSLSHLISMQQLTNQQHFPGGLPGPGQHLEVSNYF